MIEIKSFREVIIDGKPAGTVAEAIANHSARAGEIAEAALAWDTAREAAVTTAKAERDAAAAEAEQLRTVVATGRTESLKLVEGFKQFVAQAEAQVEQIATATDADEIARQKALAEAQKAKEEAEAKIAELSK